MTALARLYDEIRNGCVHRFPSKGRGSFIFSIQERVTNARKYRLIALKGASIGQGIRHLGIRPNRCKSDKFASIVPPQQCISCQRMWNVGHGLLHPGQMTSLSSVIVGLGSSRQRLATFAVVEAGKQFLCDGILPRSKIGMLTPLVIGAHDVLESVIQSGEICVGIAFGIVLAEACHFPVSSDGGPDCPADGCSVLLTGRIVNSPKRENRKYFRSPA